MYKISFCFEETNLKKQNSVEVETKLDKFEFSVIFVFLKLFYFCMKLKGF